MSIGYHEMNKNESGNFVISHSNLCDLDPQMGGHPRKFYKSLTEPFSEYKPSFEKGDLLHLWMERKKSFVIADQDKPVPQMSALIEEFYKIYHKEEWKNDAVLVGVLQKDSEIGIDENVAYQEAYRICKEIGPITEIDKNDFILFIQCFRIARINVNYNAKHLELTVIKAFIPQIPYYKFLISSDGRIILTPAMRDLLTNCMQSIKDHPFANKLLFELEGLHEVEFFWQTTHDNYGIINRKGKLDKLIVDLDKKTVIISDLKTTSYPVADFNKFDGAYYKYKLGRQLVNYAIGFFKNNPQYNITEWNVRLYNIVVQTDGEYPTMVYCTKDFFKYKEELEELEKRALYHEKKGYNLTMEEYENNCITI
jgi:hypothetical protein